MIIQPFEDSTILFMFPQLILIVLWFLLSNCSAEEEKNVVQSSETVSACQGCHSDELDQHHSFSCTTCHLGSDRENSQELSHQGLVAHPAHPSNAATHCGGCHDRELAMVVDNSHYSLAGHVNTIRNVFGAEQKLDATSLQVSSPEPESVLQLVDDLLRRRCLRCHVYYPGDDFPLVKHATGCGSCHLDFSDGHLVSHTFLAKPTDSRCLSCHYGNHVGADYYGRYEHDFNEEFRTPYTTSADFFRPFGVEYHQLEPDIHQRAGMICVDCHSQMQVMGNQVAGPSCSACHDPALLLESTPDGITATRGRYSFTSAATGTILSVPVITHPAHVEYENKATCQVCHARWSFNDAETHLIRIDHEEFDDFDRLSLDGSSEVKHIIWSHIDEDGSLLEPFMSDKLTGDRTRGIWLKGFFERRWEHVLLTRLENGTIVPARPILDLSLSWIDSEETLRFDNIRPQKASPQPYTPHTTGAAGIFYEERIRQFLQQERSRLSETVGKTL